MTDASLDKLRKKIDKIDDQILDLLVKRANVVEEVGKTKNLNGTRHSIIRPAREATMIRRMSQKDHQPISSIAIASIWRMIISSSINIEENPCVSAYITEENAEAYWLAREYFGPFTPTERHPTSMEVVKDVLDGKATVGVLPIWDKESPKPWWVRIAESEDPPYVFAKLPFIKLSPSKKSPLVAIGYVKPEASSDDKSLWIIKAEETISYEDVIEPILQKSFNNMVEQIDHYRFLGNPTMRYYLVAIADFVESDNKAMADFIKKANDAHDLMTKIETHYLGAYATPITFAENENDTE